MLCGVRIDPRMRGDEHHPHRQQGGRAPPTASSIVPAPSLALREFVAGKAARLLMVEAIAGKSDGFAQARRKPPGKAAWPWVTG
jgi:hypothetical protein